MNSSVAANFTDSPEQCTVDFTLYHFKVTTDVLVPGILSCLPDAVGILISVPLNLLVILAICLNSSLHHNSDYVLVVLAISDLFISALLQPVFFINKIQHLLSKPSCTTATIFQVILPIVRNASVVSEMLVSLERTIAVMAPYWYEEWVTPRRLFAAPACVWFVWTLVHLSLLWAGFGKAILLLPAAFLAVCLLVTAVCYGLLVKVANHQENQVQAQQQQVQRSEEEKKKIKRERKALWTALYINGAYFVGYLPLLSAAVIWSIVNLSAKKVFLLHSWSGTVGCLIAGANPIILCWRNPRVGREMKKLLRFGNGNRAVQRHVQPLP